MTPGTARIGRPHRIAIDLWASLELIGSLGKYLGLAAALPIAVALWYGEPIWPYVVAGAITSGFGFALERLAARPGNRVGIREGFLVVSMTWLLAAAFACIPYLLAGGDQLSHPVDAYFEGMSGFTTTGATVVTDFDDLDRSLAMWRQFTQWLGGMGIIVLAIAVLPRLRVGGRQLMESELPGPEIGTLSERIRSTARRLWLLYVLLTAAEALALSAIGWLGYDDRMTPYEAIAHAFTTLPTGGFSTQARSIEAFSAASQWVIAVFIILAGANFALMYRAILRRRPQVFVRDEEFRLYVALIAAATVFLTAQLWAYGLAEGEEAVRTGLFQVVTIMTSTGYATTDFALWPILPILTLFALMFVGGSAGSTSGGIKIVRHLLLGKILRREIDQTLSAELVMPVRLNRTPVDEKTLRAVAAFVLLYIGLWVVGAAVIAVEVAAFTNVELSAFEPLAISASAIGNVGPAFGVTGPMGSYAPLGDASKITMIVLMWAGRLEILPVVVLLTRHYWRL
ncbi:MAG TPA: TrkH family potassium uptake protein [Gaiellaceae bacterium]|nr:TrkH family potassium uptake protein [Gaiellaceae bacterium]